PTPNPTLLLIKAQVVIMDLAFQNAIQGGKDKKALQKIEHKKMLDMMNSLMAYVQNTSLGDETKILSTGFEVKKQRTPVGILAPPSNVRSSFGFLPGEVLLLWGGVRGRLAYRVQTNDTPGNDANWVDYTFTGKARLVVSGLISSKEYAFRIATLSAEGLGNYCPVVIQKAL
ncbi:MAG: fibronectin type III domain-containing protein, partial [Bacteroidia bacterium]|nr:fibronectin type III domain-containing protein [Bacteroidia bacterium]